MNFISEPVMERAAMFRCIRDYFEKTGYLEVDTPVLTPSPIPESHIELFQTRKILPNGLSASCYLVPSPEVWMKIILASGSPSLFQLGKCFRNGEQLDRWHRNEFTMLEWYSLHKTAIENIPVLQDLIHHIIQAVNPKAEKDIADSFRIITMEEAFQNCAGFSLESHLIEAGITEAGRVSADYRKALNRISEFFRYWIKENNIAFGNDENETADDLFHRLFIALVEENLPKEQPLVLTHWPALIPTLARTISGTPWADRWEFYIRGVEIANCYGEETDADLLQQYWDEESVKINGGKDSQDADREWIHIIAGGMPPCSGVALGLERLQALIRGDDSLKGLDLFPIRDNMPR